ncbi:hypothetical protein [Ramlibacter rhizophilus]|uniref:Uncharacterized protein n=1 Tax=Ramlibacter rhizophilus TaxID=1781167 RepID=A0A4Z0BGJ6_9BURK|nr:hypothetical protein [Ramlibacter rhizophilus]TFY97509.1 hypothetical protein EZ242_18490 [Ramlibacter rhizophilus]
MKRIGRSILQVAAGAALLLLVPWAAMQLSDEVRWGPGDFVLAWGLLFAAGCGVVLAAAGIERPAVRSGVVAGIVLLAAVVWAELAVGLFH